MAILRRRNHPRGMANRVSVFMITAGEIQFIQDLLEELRTLADPSEYYDGEVEDAVELLQKLKEYDTQKVVDYFATQIDNQKENENYEHSYD